MTFDVSSLLDLWTSDYGDATTATAAFGEVYCDPVVVNGAPISVADMVERARKLKSALTDVSREVLDVCDAGTKVAVAFRLGGLHIGPLATSAGELPPSGQHVSMRVIDILTFTDGKISEITMVAEEPRTS